MKYNKTNFITAICVTFLISAAIILGFLFGLQRMPKGTLFSFDTLGVFLGAVGSVGAIFAIWFTTRKQVNEQNKIQKQNVRIQLFEKRYEVYKETEKYFIELMKNDYDSLYLLALSMMTEEKDKVELGLGKVRHLFGTKV